ncbi:MAG: SAM-dependent methyltransferase [Desulfurococcales archaeon]|nr:SAM-dependent methyltransferase [Desulfurococcales archaeon]
MVSCSDKAWLALAGAGLERGHLTRRLIELAECADKVLVETYTLPGSKWIVDELSRIVGGRVVEADRSALEDYAYTLLDEARKERILVVTPGDPLIATTHRSLIPLARQMGVHVEIIPGISGVCCAKTRSGLDYYLFGKTITLPGPWRRVKPYSVLEGVAVNICSGLHTLLLLDIHPGTGDQLRPCEGLRMIQELEAEMGVEGFLDGIPFILVDRACMEGERVEATIGVEGVCGLDPPRGPASLVVPGRAARYELELLPINVARVLQGWTPPTENACKLHPHLRTGVG